MARRPHSSVLHFRVLSFPLLPALVLGSLMLGGCGSADDSTQEAPSEPETAAAETIANEPASSTADAPETNEERLARVLAAQPEEARARFAARNPQATLELFGVEPGMTVVEALPGGGWYSKILIPYLGAEGQLIGANYPPTLFEQFGFATEEFMAELETWVEDFPTDAGEWCDEDCASVRGFFMSAMPEDVQGTADVVLFIRALHNMARFQNEGIDEFLDQAFADAHAVLKPGGVMGVVQHAAGEDMPDEWAAGAAGYLKPSFVIAQAEAAGFELEAESDINANPADRPTVEDIVWRLAPTLGTTEEGSEERATIEEIGESNRMTLKFRKPEASSGGY